MMQKEEIYKFCKSNLNGDSSSAIHSQEMIHGLLASFEKNIDFA